MATLNNPINPQNIVDRFADYVVATANSGIAWGTNAYPFAEWGGGLDGIDGLPYAGYATEFGGTTAGKAIGITGANIDAVGNVVNAANIYNTLLTETAAYTNIRNLRAILFVGGAGGNNGTRGTPGAVFDTTAPAYFNAAYLQTIGAGASDVVSGSTATVAGLETFFDNLRASYNSARSNTVTLQVNVCHASCHFSCHDSRGRR
jgi:hypothetical protein